MACNMPIQTYPQLPSPVFNSDSYLPLDSWAQPVPANSAPCMPSGPAFVQPNGGGMPANMPQSYEPLPSALTQAIYTPGYLRSIIGSLVRVEFLIGDRTTDRMGILREVGANFILLDSPDSSSTMLCDLPSVKFVTVINNPTSAELYGFFSQN